MIKPNDRVFICGATGSGKSVAAVEITRHCRNLIVHDYKRDLDVPNATIINGDLKALAKAPPGRYVYRPDPTADKKARAIENDTFFKIVYRRRHTVCWVDEVYAVTDGPTSLPPHLRGCITAGRSLGIGMVMLSQRPAHIPLFCMSESEHILAFRLAMKRDRDRIAEFSEGLNFKELGEFDFFYMDTTSDAAPVKARINPKGA